MKMQKAFYQSKVNGVLITLYPVTEQRTYSLRYCVHLDDGRSFLGYYSRSYATPYKRVVDNIYSRVISTLGIQRPATAPVPPHATAPAPAPSIAPRIARTLYEIASDWSGETVEDGFRSEAAAEARMSELYREQPRGKFFVREM